MTSGQSVLKRQHKPGLAFYPLASRGKQTCTALNTWTQWSLLSLKWYMMSSCDPGTLDSSNNSEFAHSFSLTSSSVCGVEKGVICLCSLPKQDLWTLLRISFSFWSPQGEVRQMTFVMGNPDAARDLCTAQHPACNSAKSKTTWVQLFYNRVRFIYTYYPLLCFLGWIKWYIFVFFSVFSL